MRRSLRRIAIGLALGLNVAPAQALTYLVGADSAVCDFGSIQAAINAAQSNPGPDAIRIASNQSYAGLALKIGQQDLTVDGGYATCAAALVATTLPSTRTFLSGSGAPQDSVLEITGSGVRVLRGLLIRNGDDPTSGGGIQFNGSGELILENVDVEDNQSAFGGGINFHGTASPAVFTVGPRVRVQNNTATESGGGIRVTGRARLLMASDNSIVHDNRALGSSSTQQGHGGGILIVAPARGEIASPGRLDAAAIANNEARYGGGLAVIAPDGSDGDFATAILYSVDAERPLRIDGNRASAEGGGIYLGGDFEPVGDNEFAALYAYEIRIENNRAPQGAAIALQEVSELQLNGFFAAGFPPVGAVSCGPEVACNRIAGNRSETIDGAPTQGATVFVAEEEVVFARLRRVELSGNAGGSVLRGGVVLDKALLAQNSTTQALAVFNNLASTSVRNVTVADNDIGGPALFVSGVPIALSHSIIEQPARNVFQLDGGSISELHDVMVSDCGLIACSAATHVTAFASGPRFTDPEGGDYRLHPASLAVDFAAPITGDQRDLDNSPYDQDLSLKPDRFGTRDLGAYERQNIGNLVRNGEFVEHVRLWTAGAQATLNRDATGAETPGALRIADTTSTLATEVVARQCVPLPGPGSYKVAGVARGEGLLALSRDRVAIRWRYFAEASDANCGGVPSASGELLFPNGTTFGQPLNPQAGLFDALVADEFSQVEIELVVTEGSISINDPTAGLFDDVGVFVLGAPGSIFRDGFEAGN